MKETKFIKTKEGIFEVISIDEFWCAKIYDYGDEYMQNWPDGRYHKVFADSEERANYLVDDAYKEYSDKKIGIERIRIELKNIISNELSDKNFKSLEEKDTFLETHMDFSDKDRDIIFRYKELFQKEMQHNESIISERKNARGIQSSINSAAGLPMDWC